MFNSLELELWCVSGITSFAQRRICPRVQWPYSTDHRLESGFSGEKQPPCHWYLFSRFYYLFKEEICFFQFIEEVVVLWKLKPVEVVFLCCFAFKPLKSQHLQLLFWFVTPLFSNLMEKFLYQVKQDYTLEEIRYQRYECIQNIGSLLLIIMGFICSIDKVFTIVLLSWHAYWRGVVFLIYQHIFITVWWQLSGLFLWLI